MSNSQSYQPLTTGGEYSPSLRPYGNGGDITGEHQLDLDGYSAAKQSLSSGPQASGEYDNYRYNDQSGDIESKGLISEPQYHLYKRRWYGLAELTLLNLVVGWGFIAPSVVSSTAAAWYGISLIQLNNLSIAGSLVFLVPAPFVIWTLNRYGPKTSMMIAAVLLIIGNWLIYAATMTHNFNLNIAGTVFHSLAMPFVLTSPTRLSRQWFGDRGRTIATAGPSLGYVLGSGIGAVTAPFMVKPLGPFDYSTQSLIIAIAITAAAVPAFFIPSKPPTPPSAVAAAKTLSMRKSLMSLLRNPSFYLQLFSFSVLAGAMESVIQVVNQSLVPYGFPQQDAGYAIAFCIFIGVATALIVSPILDYTKAHLIALKVIVIILAAAYTALPFIPQTGSTAGLFAVYALIGAAAISVEPCVLEFQASWTHPVPPEFSSVICWSGSKLISTLFIFVVGEELVMKKPEEGQPAYSLFNGLIFIAVMTWLCVPCAFLTGRWIFKRSEASHVQGND